MNSECPGRLHHRLVYFVWRVDSPRLSRHCDPDHWRSPVSPILPTLMTRYPRSDPAGSWLLPVLIHGDIPSSTYTSGFLRLSVSTCPLRQNSLAGTAPRSCWNTQGIRSIRSQGWPAPNFCRTTRSHYKPRELCKTSDYSMYMYYYHIIICIILLAVSQVWFC